MTNAQRKEELRRRASLLPKADAAHLLEQFAQLPQVVTADTVMVFCGVGREPDTSALIRTLLERGQRVALPVCLPGRKLEARVISDESQLVPGKFGIPEPEYGCPTVSHAEIDAILVPGLMADRDGYRLGFGGGYYDRFLADYTGFTAMVCPCDRLVDSLPREEFDRPVDLVITDHA
jgi:5-formyltetrahydrofolate cyclo-ligase